MSRRSGSISDDPIAERTADAHLLDGGSAIGAAAAGFFAAAAERPGVLLGPLSILIAGIGVGARALDGRLRQPGLGAKRPRGFTVDQSIPSAARIAAPAGVSALAVALAYDDDFRLASVMAPAIRLAKASGAERRASVLDRIAAVGPRALTEAAIREPLVAAGGAAEGGGLTSRDLEGSQSVDHPATERREGDLVELRPPWASSDEEGPPAQGRDHVLCTMDARGFAVALCYAEPDDGLVIEELELALLGAAAPVLRGVPRIAPGTPIPAHSPIHIRLREGDPISVWGRPSVGGSELELRRDTRTRNVRVVRGAA